MYEFSCYDTNVLEDKSLAEKIILTNGYGEINNSPNKIAITDLRNKEFILEKLKSTFKEMQIIEISQ